MWTYEDKQKIIKVRNVKQLELSQGSYFVKKVTLLQGINEIIGMNLARLIGLKCATYDLFIIGDCCYSLSENLNNKGKFTIASNYNINKNNLYEIWSNLEKNFEDIENIMFDIVKMYIFDLILMISDRHTDNYGFITENNDTKLIIFDNEYMFSGDVYMISSLENRSFNETKENEIRSFLFQSSQEFVDLFNEIYNILTIQKLKEVIESIENRYNVILEEKDVILKMYENNYKNIGEILKGYKYGR